MKKNPIRYIMRYDYAPATAEYVFRKCGGSGLLQHYVYNHTGNIIDVKDLYTCVYEDNDAEEFRAMLAEARKHMPERKMMYVEKPGFMYTDEELSAMNEEIYLSMVEYNLQYNDWRLRCSRHIILGTDGVEKSFLNKVFLPHLF